MTFALHVGLFFRRKLLETLRQPVWIVTGLSTPLLYLALFEPLLRSVAGGAGLPAGQVLGVFVPGILALMAFGAGMGAGWVVIWEMDTGVIERLRVARLGHPELPRGDGVSQVGRIRVRSPVMLAG
jgi:ABC-2 type transport system permease protein